MADKNSAPSGNQPKDKNPTPSGNQPQDKQNLRYYERKRLVITQEKKNYDKLILFRGTDNWWKAINKSAVYLALDISLLIKSNIKLREDADYEFKAEYVASIPNIETMTKKLADLGIKLIDEKEDIYIFLLKEPYDANQYQLMLEQNKAMLEKAGEMALPYKLMPNLLEDLKELQHSVFWEVRKMDCATRELIGNDFYKSVREMLIKYTKMARSRTPDAETYLYDTMSDIETVNSFYYALDSLKSILSEKKSFEIQYLISKTRSQIIYEMKRIGMENIDKEFGGLRK